MFCSFPIEELRQRGGIAQEGQTMGGQSLLSVFDPECEVGQTVEEAIDAYVEAKGVAFTTGQGYHTLRKRWVEWSSNPRSTGPRVVGDVTAEDVSEFLEWVFSEAKRGGKNAGRTHNKHRGNLHAVFAWAVKQRETSRVVDWPDRRPQRSVAGLYFFTRRELSAIYWATFFLPRPSRWKDPRSIGSMLRAALSVFLCYGLDTYAVFYQKHKQQLCWGNVADTRLPPGRVAKVQCPHGWIGTRRQKTDRALYLPMHPIVLAHLDAIRPADAGPDDPIFGRCGGGKPNDLLRWLCDYARIAGKIDAETGAPAAWVLKDLRKTCGTAYGERTGKLILGHSDGSITGRHYANSLPRVVRAVRRFRFPRAFRSISDDSITPPEMLFVK